MPVQRRSSFSKSFHSLSGVSCLDTGRLSAVCLLLANIELHLIKKADLNKCVKPFFKSAYSFTISKISWQSFSQSLGRNPKNQSPKSAPRNHQLAGDYEAQCSRIGEYLSYILEPMIVYIAFRLEMNKIKVTQL